MASSNELYIVSSPDQEKEGYYKVIKTANITTTLATLNNARALRDFKVIKDFKCSDIKQLEEFLVKALKTRYITNSKEWIKVDPAGLTKVITTIESLVEIVNNS